MKTRAGSSNKGGWRKKATLRRSVSLMLAAFSFSTLIGFTPDSAIAASADGTRGTQVVDASGAVWTFNGEQTLRNGVWVGSGAAVEYFYLNQVVYAITSDNSVWRWTGSAWTYAASDVSSIGSSAPISGAAGTLRSILTTGSVTAGSKQVSVASAAGFVIGDWVIVEIGNEAGQGQRGTRGVGGTWPSKSYATEAQLLADRSQPNRQYAWAEDTGYVYWWLDGQWFDIAPDRPNTFYMGSYYLGKAIPRSLQARITAINGNTLTLDKAAATSASGANVHLDTAPILSTLAANGGNVSLPAGNYAVGGAVWVRDKAGFVLSGQGQDQTRIFSPKGVTSATLTFTNSPSTTVRDLTLQGNFRDQGFGMNWDGSTPAALNQPVTDYDIPQGSGWPRGVFIHSSSNSVVQDVRVIDVAQSAVGVSYADNVWARRVQSVQNDLLRQYLAWQFQWADATGGGCEDCEVRSNYIISGFEAFKSTNVQFIRPKGMNALFAMNGSGGWFIDGADLRFTANSLPPESDRNAASPWHPIVNINTNIGVTPQTGMGGTIRNSTIIQSGYVTPNNDSLKGVVVNDNNPNVRVEGLAYYAPDFKSGSVSNGALGLNSTGPSTTVNGVQVVGGPQPGRANIFIMQGGGVNCSGQVVQGCDTGSFTTPLMQAFLAGDRSGWSLPADGGSSNTGGTGGGSSSGSGSGSGSTTPPAPQTPSADGTRGAQVVDSSGAVWTFQGTKTLRNGTWMGNGEASEYFYVNSTVYAIASDGSIWKWNNGWSYAGSDIAAIGGGSSSSGGGTGGSSGGSSGSGSSGGGSSGGSGTVTTSPNGTRGKQVVDATGAVWTFDGTKTLRNGVWMGNGEASEYLYVNGTVYAITAEGAWKWSNGWSFATADVAALQAQAGSTPTPPNTTPPPSTPKGPSVTMDFSGSGTSSVFWRNESAGQNVIWTINKGAVANEAFITGAGSNWHTVGSGDFNGDGKADIVWRDDEGNVAIWLMDGTSVAGGAVVANAAPNWKVQGVGDFNGDGKADILWRAPDGSVSLWLMDNLTITTRGTLNTVSSTWTVAGIGDLNKDGKADIVWRNSADGSVVTWLMNGTTITKMIPAGKRSTAWSIVGVADFNGDGKADLLWRNTTKGQNDLWFMDGGVQSGSTLSLPVLADTKWNVVGTGDYNGDGKADILFRHAQTGDNTVWLLNGAAATPAAIPAVSDAQWVVVKP